MGGLNGSALRKLLTAAVRASLEHRFKIPQMLWMMENRICKIQRIDRGNDSKWHDLMDDGQNMFVFEKYTVSSRFWQVMF